MKYLLFNYLHIDIVDLTNTSDNLKVNKLKLNKKLLIYSHYRRETISYDAKHIDSMASAKEINLNCLMNEGVKSSLNEGTVKFRIETIKGQESNITFAETAMDSYLGTIGDTFKISLKIAGKVDELSEHKLIAYVVENGTEIIVGELIVCIQVGAWMVTRNWSKIDVTAYANFVNPKIKEYISKDLRVDCADLALTLFIDYSSKEGLPLELKTKIGKSYKSYGREYSNIVSYKKDVLPNVNSIDISSNTFTVDKKTEAHVGDMIILKKPFGHIVVYNKIEGKRELSYGNLSTENGVVSVPPIKTGSWDWSNNTEDGRVYDPDTTKVHRWNMLNF